MRWPRPDGWAIDARTPKSYDAAMSTAHQGASDMKLYTIGQQLTDDQTSQRTWRTLDSL
jgi:hypothetical protein